MTRRSLALLLLVPPLVLAATGAARAALYVPTKTADGADGACDADCSLREAVIAANAHPGEDVVVLRPGFYQLEILGDDDAAASGDLDVTDALSILGDGAPDTAIFAGGSNGLLGDRILDVGAGTSLVLRDLQLVSGRAPGDGGGIRNRGTLTMLRSEIAGCVATGNGGAIFSDAGSTLTVTESALITSTAVSGGGIATSGETQLANVTLDSNQAQTGGGIYRSSASHLVLNNVTLTFNSATIKGGGIFAESSVFVGLAPRLTNSLLAANIAPSDPDCSGSFDSSYNVIANATGCDGASAANHDLLGTAQSPLDAKLGALRVQGGDTHTHEILAGSPAIDAGNPAAAGEGACEATDQRGAGRPAGLRCDAGAFEVTTTCVPGGTTLCLGEGGRFRVTADWRTTSGNGLATSVTFTRDSGYLWFFSPDNVEVTIKVLDACIFSDRFWVFASGMTDVEVHLTVTDTRTGTVKTYNNPLGRTFTTTLDTNAFATCP